MNLGRSFSRFVIFLFGILTIGLLSFALAAEEASDTLEKKAEAAAETETAPQAGAGALGLEGMTVVRDPETGALRAATAAEAKAMGVSRIFSRSKSGLKQGEMRPDGTLALAVPGLQLSFAVARLDGAGKVVTDCVDSEEEAASIAEATTPAEKEDSDVR